MYICKFVFFLIMDYKQESIFTLPKGAMTTLGMSGNRACSSGPSAQQTVIISYVTADVLKPGA